MKKVLLNLSDAILSREQMKGIKGGYNDGNASKCSVTCPGQPTPLEVECPSCSSGKKNGLDCVWCEGDPNSEKCCIVV